MSKLFIGFGAGEDAIDRFGLGLIDDKWKWKEKKISVVDDGTRWPQYSSKTITIMTIEMDDCIVAFEETVRYHDPILV